MISAATTVEDSRHEFAGVALEKQVTLRVVCVCGS